MQFLTLIAIAATAVSATVLPLPSYQLNSTHVNLQPIRWHAPSYMGNITLEGHPHEVIAQIAALKPKWQTNSTYYEHMVTKAHAEHNHTLSHLEKRSNRVNQFCWMSQWKPVPVLKATGNYDYVFTTWGDGMCEAMPNSCGRMACQYDAALLMCNDHNTPAVIPCNTLAMNAKFISDYCTKGFWTLGQAFYINPNYNVLVKKVDPGKHC